MKIQYLVSYSDASKARAFLDEWADDPFVRRRRLRNVSGERKAPTRDLFWEALVSALLTTQQRSGPDTPVNRFVTATPFPLPLRACRKHQPCEEYVLQCIRAFGGLRRGPTIAEQLNLNLQWLESEGWKALLPLLDSLHVGADATQERATARVLADHMKGLGPKQSRNLLQMLGLTRHEIPIDSRISKWLNDFGFPFPLSAKGLADPGYYELALDCFQALCAEIGVLPCLMDAAIFASFDKGTWTDTTNTRW